MSIQCTGKKLFKSKDELIGDIITLLQSPAKNVISALQSGGNKLSGIDFTMKDDKDNKWVPSITNLSAEKGLKLITKDFTSEWKTVLESPQYLKRARLEKIAGPLPSNYFNLSSDEQIELFGAKLIKRAEELEEYKIKLGVDSSGNLATQKEIDDDKSGSSKDDKEGRELEPVREMHFFHWVLVILFWGYFLWILGQNGCPDTGGGLPMRR